jgi:hypothetical protein
VEPFARIAQRVILSGPPHEGVFEADGHRIRVSPSARIAFAKAKDPFTSLNQVGADAIMAYEASRREPDGTLVADALEFRRNEAEPGERELWKRLEMDLKEPDFDRHKSGGLRIYRRYYEMSRTLKRSATSARSGAGWCPRISATCLTRPPRRFRSGSMW